MKTDCKKDFIELLGETPIVSAVCKKLGISRQTLYRWKQEDYEFRKDFDTAIGRGRDNINDLAESKIIEKIKDGDFGAARFWLQNNKTNYTVRKSEDFREILSSELNKTKNRDLNLGDRLCE